MMMTFTRQMEQGFNIRRGFTLIELLIVVALISILISITIPRMEGMRDEANAVKAKAETKAIKAAVESYAMRQVPSSYPSSTVNICSGTLNLVKPLIIGEKLYDPFNASIAEYNYFLSDNGKYYAVTSVGIDGIANITGIGNTGVLIGTNNDDIYATNGTGF